MSLWFMSNPDLTHALIVDREQRSDAAGRAVYRIVSGGVAAVSQLARLIGRLGQAYGRWQRRRAAMWSLQSLDNRLLGDMGIARSDIRRIVDATLDHGPLSVPELAELEAQHEAGREAGRETDEPVVEDLRLAA